MVINKPRCARIRSTDPAVRARSSRTTPPQMPLGWIKSNKEDGIGILTKDNEHEYFIDKTYTADGKRKMIATREELEYWQIPLHLRDYCAHIQIKLTECRRINYANPHACHHELHDVERCQWEQYRRRMRQKEMWQQAKKNVEERNKNK